MTEAVYQQKIIKELKKIFLGCIVLKNDSSYIQGIPDLTIFYGDKWATLEVKVSEDSDRQPNQDYYVDIMDQMSFSSFIFPENEKQVLADLERYFFGGHKNVL